MRPSENNLIIERKILEKAASKQPMPAPQGTAAVARAQNEQKIGDYYASCMDEQAIEKKGLEPLKPELERIAKLQSKAELPDYLAHAHSLGSNVFFEFGSQPDFKNATMEIAETDQSGLGLPDRDYYLRTDAKSVELRNLYTQHIQRMFVLAGDKPEDATGKSKVVLSIETALAKGVTRPRQPPRSRQAVPLHDRGRIEQAEPDVRLEPVLHRHRRAQFQQPECHGSRFRKGPQRGVRPSGAERHQDLSGLAAALNIRVHAAQGFCR